MDDSGESGPIAYVEHQKLKVRKIRNPKKQEFRYLSVGTIIFNEIIYAEFTTDWLNLQLDIQKTLRLPHLPPIHMRLMWGKNPHKRPEYTTKQRKMKNPYYGVDSNIILDWIIRAYEILENYNIRGHLVYAPYAEDVYEFIYYWENIIDHPIIQGDYEILMRTSPKYLKEYLNIASSPLLDILIKRVTTINRYINRMKGTIGLIIDDTHDKSGFSLSPGLLEQLADGRRQQIKVLGTPRNIGLKADYLPMLQAADLVGYFYRRALFDQFAKDIIEKYIRKPTKVGETTVIRGRRNNVAKELRRHNQKIAIGLYQRYLFAYEHITRANPSSKFAQLLIEPDGFLDRANRAIDSVPYLATIDNIIISPLHTPTSSEYDVSIRKWS